MCRERGATRHSGDVKDPQSALGSRDVGVGGAGTGVPRGGKSHSRSPRRPGPNPAGTALGRCPAPRPQAPTPSAPFPVAMETRPEAEELPEAEEEAYQRRPEPAGSIGSRSTGSAATPATSDRARLARRCGASSSSKPQRGERRRPRPLPRTRRWERLHWNQTALAGLRRPPSSRAPKGAFPDASPGVRPAASASPRPGKRPPWGVKEGSRELARGAPVGRERRLLGGLGPPRRPGGKPPVAWEATPPLSPSLSPPECVTSWGLVGLGVEDARIGQYMSPLSLKGHSRGGRRRGPAERE